jgi:ribosomal 50S subunit-recycling heat shock protein
LDGSYQWRVGVIRWMQYSRDNGLELGAQILSPKAIAAKAQRYNKPKEEPFDCIMLPGIRVLNQNPSVITPAHAFKVGDRLNVTVLEQEMTIKLIEASEHTGSFTQFQFANNEVATRQQKAEKKKQSEKNPDDFDEIWSSL